LSEERNEVLHRPAGLESCGRLSSFSCSARRYSRSAARWGSRL